MKYKLIELSLWMISAIPIVMVTKDRDGVFRYKKEAIHVIGTVIAWTIISIITVLIAVVFITHDLKKDFQYIKQELIEIKSNQKTFDRRIDILEKK